VIITGWFVMPLGTWVPKLAGWEHAVRIGFNHNDLEMGIIHADGSVDHRNHGPNCPGHPVPKGTHDHSKHGFRMSHMERESTIGVPIPAPVIRILPMPFQLGDLPYAEVSDEGNAVPPVGPLPPIELQRTTVLLI
jgi:hypothetical protein